jgi:hypothetical protein
MKINDILENLVISADDTGCHKNLTVVEKKWVIEIEEYLKTQEEQEREQEKKRLLRDVRAIVADKEFEKAVKEVLDIPEESEVVDVEGWEDDAGENVLTQKFYYENPVADEPSLTGTFAVEFEKDSAKVINVHSNT